MVTRFQTYLLRAGLIAAASVLVAAMYLSPPAWALGTDPNQPAISIIKIEKGVDKPAATAATGTAAATGTGAGSGRRGNANAAALAARRKVSTKGEVPYIITVRNGSEFPAHNVVLEYHFYNRTADISNGLANYTIDDITSTEYLDIAADKSRDITTEPIPYEDTETTAAAGGGRTRNVGGSTMTITSLLGYHVELRYNDKLISQKEFPDNLQELLRLNTPKE